MCQPNRLEERPQHFWEVSRLVHFREVLRQRLSEYPYTDKIHIMYPLDFHCGRSRGSNYSPIVQSFLLSTHISRRNVEYVPNQGMEHNEQTLESSFEQWMYE